MNVKRQNLMERLKMWGCGRRETNGLSEHEKLALHEFKNDVAELGEKLYSKMPAAKADEYIVKAVFSIIEETLKTAP
jgi:hypothetical protein